MAIKWMKQASIPKRFGWFVPGVTPCPVPHKRVCWARYNRFNLEGRSVVIHQCKRKKTYIPSRLLSDVLNFGMSKAYADP